MGCGWQSRYTDRSHDRRCAALQLRDGKGPRSRRRELGRRRPPIQHGGPEGRPISFRFSEQDQTGGLRLEPGVEPLASKGSPPKPKLPPGGSPTTDHQSEALLDQCPKRPTLALGNPARLREQRVRYLDSCLHVVRDRAPTAYLHHYHETRHPEAGDRRHPPPRRGTEAEVGRAGREPAQGHGHGGDLGDRHQACPAKKDCGGGGAAPGSDGGPVDPVARPAIQPDPARSRLPQRATSMGSARMGRSSPTLPCLHFPRHRGEGEKQCSAEGARETSHPASIGPG